MRSVAVIALSLMLLTAPPAHADYQRVDDRNDTRGRLDIKWARQGHDYNGKIRYRISTYDNYAERDLRHGRFVLRFDIDDDEGFERFVTVHWRDFERTDGGKLAAPLRNAKWKIVARLGTAHWDGHKLRVWIARKHLGRPTRYRTEIESQWRGKPCRNETCVDQVEPFTHRLWPFCFGQDPTIVGTPGDDTIEGTRDRDIILGRAGDDRIETNDGWDHVCGGPGSDHLLGSKRPDQLSGGAGDDRLVGRAATYRCNDTPTAPGDCAFPYNGLYGGAGADELIGGVDADWMWGARGPDALFGRDSDDRLYGGREEDVLDGGRGRDDCHSGEIRQRC